MVLRRWQSVGSHPNGIAWSGVINPDTGQPWAGWSDGGGSGSLTAHLGAILQGKDASAPGGANKHRGGDNACSLIDTTDFSSSWTGTVTIRPGYVAA